MTMKIKKADTSRRFVAKGIDFLVATILSLIFPFVGTLFAVAYLLIADGIFSGKSFGKRLIGLRVVKEGGEAISYRESIIRNFPFGVIAFLTIIPFLGWFIVLTLGLAYMVFEVYFCAVNVMGERLGDIVAGTIVIDASPGEE